MMMKKSVWSSKLQSYILIEDKQDDQEIDLQRKSINIGNGGGKKLTFIYDAVIEEKLREGLLLLIKKSVQLIRLGFNSSIYVNGSSSSHQSAELMIIKDQLETLYKGFENDERNVDIGIQSGGEILLSRNVKVSSYEAFDNQLKDLCIPQNVTPNASAKGIEQKNSIRLLH
jgi:hypothetical protein